MEFSHVEYSLQTFAYSKIILETLENGMKYIKS